MKSKQVISICASITFKKEMIETAIELEKLGFEVNLPNLSFKNSYSSTKIQNDLIRKHYEKIHNSDGVLILNLDKKIRNYIGANTFLEMGFAFIEKVPIFLYNPIPNSSLKDEVEAFKPNIINNDLSYLKKYYSEYKLSYVTSKSPIKIRAIKNALRYCDIKCLVEGIKTESEVREEPLSVEEAFEGAKNRIKNLKKLNIKKYEYIVSFEGAFNKMLKDHNYFSTAAVVTENKYEELKISVENSMEWPKEATDLIPSLYPDLGVWAQKVKGEKLKDPFNALTHGYIKRLAILENSCKNCLCQF